RLKIQFFEVFLSCGVELQLKKLLLQFIRNISYFTLKWVPDEFPAFTLLIYLWEVSDEFCFQIFRASRLVVDTGLHALGWTRQEAVDYLINHTAMPTVKVENEVDRYITMPGQALAYKVGQLKLMDLRYKAASVLGDEFDIKKFHDVVLDSVGPLDLVEDEVNAWVNAGGKKLDVVRVIQCIKLWSC
ncbi:hypothetical protein Hamer_G027930, partial [Homarus americanus]